MNTGLSSVLYPFRGHGENGIDLIPVSVAYVAVLLHTVKVVLVIYILIDNYRTLKLTKSAPNIER